MHRLLYSCLFCTSTLLLIACSASKTSTVNAQSAPIRYPPADSLRGTLNQYRNWFDVRHYDVTVEPDFSSKTIKGKVVMDYIGGNQPIMQIDLQAPLQIDSIVQNGILQKFNRFDQVAMVQLTENNLRTTQQITIYYHGKPRQAINPPWDGGWVWKTDKQGRPWMSVACQGLGASVWYPCKDHQSDEPDNGASLTIIVPKNQVAIGNGRLIQQQTLGEKTSFTWRVTDPINNYNIVPYIGSYQHFNEAYKGENGNLSCDYWVLDYNLEQATQQFTQVPKMLKAFEHWFGPYPFYNDGYKLVESPYLGMEHQSNIAYGNRFMNGYLGHDLSGTGWGSKWDYIIVHESGHEWFGNNITTNDIADMWVHEGFTDYSEILFTEFYYGKLAGQEYVQGLRKGLKNDKNVIGSYGINQMGSGDMYAKGANLLHTIRTIINDDEIFRNLLRNLNRRFYHQTVSTQQIEAFIQQYCTYNCQPIFDQYLRDSRIPQLLVEKNGQGYQAKFTNCLPNFTMPIYDGKNWVPVSANQWTVLPAGVTPKSLQNQTNSNLLID